MPIVDDPYDFGKIAAANSISDVYAMGGIPLKAIAVLGWPVEKIPADIAAKVIEGGRSVCMEAGIPLAGGHSIDSQEPIFGLAVTGIVEHKNLKRNNSAKQDDILYITKPVGVGILSTAQKRGLLKEEHLPNLIKQMSQLNNIGEELGKFEAVNAMTDITGFGLLGHLFEMAQGSGLTAELNYSSIPLIDGTREYLAQRIFPDATSRNWNCYSSSVSFAKSVNVMEAFSLLPDPQTNGGLLISVNKNSEDLVRELFEKNGLKDFCQPIGRMIAKEDKTIKVI